MSVKVPKVTSIFVQAITQQYKQPEQTKVKVVSTDKADNPDEDTKCPPPTDFKCLKIIPLDREMCTARVNALLGGASIEIRKRVKLPLHAPSIYVYPFVLSFRQETDKMNWGGPKLYPSQKPFTSFWRDAPAKCNSWLALVYEPPKWVRKTTWEAEGIPWRWWAFGLVKWEIKDTRALIIFDPSPSTCTTSTRPKDLTPSQFHIWRLTRNHGKLNSRTKRSVDFYYHNTHFNGVGRQDLALSFH